MIRRVNLGNHKLGNKKNLVTKSNKKGTYDEYPCVNCYEILHVYGIRQSKTHPGPCLVSKERAKEIDSSERESEIMYGVWATKKAKSCCPKCKTRLILCPKSGHPISQYWNLQRDDGCDLYVCPNNCPEE